ncbi:hypothetical protein CEXT_516051, partial [Caerostris extrusa]
EHSVDGGSTPSFSGPNKGLSNDTNQQADLSRHSSTFYKRDSTGVEMNDRERKLEVTRSPPFAPILTLRGCAPEDFHP